MTLLLPRFGGAFSCPGDTLGKLPDARETAATVSIAHPSGNRAPKRAEKRGKQTPEKGWKKCQEQNRRPRQSPHRPRHLHQSQLHSLLRLLQTLTLHQSQLHSLRPLPGAW